MATHSSVLAWRIPGMGTHRVRHDWSDLAAAAGTRHLMETFWSKETRNPASTRTDIIFFDTVDSRVCLRLKQKFHLFQTSMLKKKLDINIGTTYVVSVTFVHVKCIIIAGETVWIHSTEDIQLISPLSLHISLTVFFYQWKDKYILLFSHCVKLRNSWKHNTRKNHV